MSYNGWTNYETWNVSLWINNEEPSYRYWREAASEAWEAAGQDANALDGTWSRSETARFRLADRLKEEFDEANPVGDHASVWADLMGAALSEVNWAEVADALLEECEEYEGASFNHAQA